MKTETIRIHDLTTNKIIDREMNDAEYAQYLVDIADAKAKTEEDMAKQTAKTELLAKLGISATEAALLLG